MCNTENRDSGVADVEVCPCSQTPVSTPGNKPLPLDISHSATTLKRSALSNSLIDIHDQCECLSNTFEY